MASMRWGAAVGFAMFAGLLLMRIGAAGATTYTVGGKNHWTFPPNGIDTYYNDWAKQRVFYVNDSLFFNYQEGFHNVLQVSKADLDTCTASAPINTYTKSNATVFLADPGYHGFICGIASHCAGNMKMEVTVLEVGTPIPSPAAPAGAPPAGSPAGAATGPASGPAQSADDSSMGSGPRRVSALVFGTLVACCVALLL